jgi:hypothetical protein
MAIITRPTTETKKHKRKKKKTIRLPLQSTALKIKFKKKMRVHHLVRQIEFSAASGPRHEETHQGSL